MTNLTRITDKAELIKLRIVSAPLAASAYPDSFWKKSNPVCHTHAVEVNEKDDPVRILCKAAKITSVMPDSSLYDAEPVTCPACLRKMKKN